MHLRSPRLPALKAFTLIELLTVIAIIGILAAIIIPVVGKVRQNARQAQSMSNLKSIAQALTVYANDNKGNFPLLSESGPARYWSKDTLAPYLGAPAKADGTYNLHPVFIDPLCEEHHASLGDYGANPWVIVDQNSTTVTAKLRVFNLGKAPTPSRLVAVATAREPKGSGTQGTWFLTDQVAALSAWDGTRKLGVVDDRNKGMAAVAFVDGSSRALSLTELRDNCVEYFRGHAP